MRGGTKGVLSAIISPTARRDRRLETLVELKAVSSGAAVSPRRTALASRAGPDIERRPEIPESPSVLKVAGVTSNSTLVLRRPNKPLLGKRAPHL